MAGRKQKDSEPYYMISVVANMYDIHPQTLRLYEKHGLVTPSRTDGNTRLYSEKDLRRLEVILNLARDLGVNLAGIEVILNMRGKMEQMQQEINQLAGALQKIIVDHLDNGKEKIRNALVKIPRTGIVRLDIENEDGK